MRLDAYRRRLPWGIILAAGIALPCLGQSSSIQNIVTAGRLDGMRWPNLADVQRSLVKFYAPTGFAPTWVAAGQPVPTALSLIQLLQHADEKGLDPEDYDASRWQEVSRALKDAPSEATVARFDVALTVCSMRYASALVSGRVDPRNIGYRMDVAEKSFDVAVFLREQILHSANLPETFQAIEPSLAPYHRTRQALVRYMELARLDDGEKLPLAPKPIDPGKTYAGVPRLARLLRLVGDLPRDAPSFENTQIYDATLVEAVKRFQRRHGLDEDGRLGKGTIQALNVPLKDRVHQLQLSLERWRWLPASFATPPIFVNIADFRLRAVDENWKVDLDMRVVVGKAMRTQTPVFEEEMSYVIFRPYWNVPRSILRNEILPAIERDRSYLAEKSFEVTTHDGQVVTSGDVSDEVLAQLRAGRLTVRQTPGTKNALGLVKLMFPNENNVYLHDTPSTKLFARSRRDFSHGCIRVEKPAELAAWVLRHNPGWTLERVHEAMENGEDNMTVVLARPVPVFIVYGTAGAHENGEIHFSEDIYGLDAKLTEALARGYPYP
ncbi:MAG: L,D-transpeptidase family protein [Terracidiphilus sp.]